MLAAVVSFDRDRLEGLVGEQLRVRGLSGFAREVVLPLAQVVGDLWALGKIPVAAEHMASEVVVHALKAGLREARGTGFVCLAACTTWDPTSRWTTWSKPPGSVRPARSRSARATPASSSRSSRH